MNLMEAVRRRILKFLRLEKLADNPNDERYTFICDEDNIKEQQIKEYKMWYIGDSNELSNYYMNEIAYGSHDEPIYNANRHSYFWSQSVKEFKYKKVHSGVPNAITTTLVNAIGNPKIEIKEQEIIEENPLNEVATESLLTDEQKPTPFKDRLDKIIDKTKFYRLLNQQQMPLTLVEGWGAFKICFDLELSKSVMIQYYEADRVEFVYKSGILIGIIYKDYYHYKKHNYVLFETRRIQNNNSLIEFELFKLEKNNEVTPVPLNTIPELEGLQSIEIPNLNKILGVPSKLLFDPLNKNYGRSIFAGKIDLFDDLDQCLSQESQTIRVSTPVEYIPVDLMPKGIEGTAKAPNTFNRQFIELPSAPNGDGAVNGQIQTTQPQLNFAQYSESAKSILDFILTGLLSPATMGIDIAKKDNADAQREKEKVTIMTRNNIIDSQTDIIKDVLNLAMCLQEYIEKGTISIQEYDISVTFNEFANPSFENELETLYPIWSGGGMSTKKYVDLIWGDKLSDKEREEEIAWLDSQREKDNLTLGDFEDEGEVGTGLSTQTEQTDIIDQVEQ